MKVISLFMVLVILIFNASKMNAQDGLITGRVMDAKTREALIGVNVIVIELESTGAATDNEGNFQIKVPVGSYSVKASLIGYQSVVKTDVVVSAGRGLHILINMSESTLSIDQVTVTADYFDEAIIENDLSTVMLHSEEVRRSPGSSQDFQRILQAMAGVAFSTDQSNELLVRGGSPNENLTVLDNIEIHSTSHYPNTYNSGGPINMINVELIQDIQFSTGGFISKYGDKLSSVLSVTTREGTRIRDFSTNANISMAGYGAVLEGSINNGRGSWLLSARNSYINLIAGAVGLTAIPYYHDVQFKAVYDLTKKHQISWTGIYGNDRIDIEGTPDRNNLIMANSKDSIDVESVDVKQFQYATGLTLKSLWTKNFYSLITLSTNNYNSKVLVSSNFTERKYDSNGDVFDPSILNSRTIFSNENDNGETTLRTVFVLNIDKQYELNFGGSLKFIQFKDLTELDSDTVRYDVNKDNFFDNTVILPAADLLNDFNFFQYSKSFLYLNNKLKLFSDRLTLNFGIRYDYFSYSNRGNLSPRLSASYHIIPNITSLNFAYGEFYQTQALPVYGDRYQSEVNRYLQNTNSRHFVLGLEHIFNEGLKLTAEAYVKYYSDLPVREDFIHFSDRTFRSEKYLNIGRKRTRGIDILMQQKLVKDIYGTLSYSRMWTEVDDPRIGYEGNNYVSDYDFPHIFTIIVGKRFKDLRKKLDGMPFYIKYPSFLFPFSDDMEISLRWRYASGKPNTPREYTPYEQHREGGVKWSNGWWVQGSNINGERFSDYHRLDFGFNSRFNFHNWNAVVFLSVQNIYNRKNISQYRYNSDGTIDNIYQYALLPVFGLEVEF
ncbi:MAG: TonB-dependent receptor [Bacteroidetes bacterium]|nr:TonB-dependent receptor [Bacteroidota bacterium]